MSHTNQPPKTIVGVPFGRTSDGQAVDIFTLRNQAGMEARIMAYGGIVVSLTAPDRNGKFADVVLGYDHFDAYLKNMPYFGALVGRYANRIGGGQFTLGGKTYSLPKNNGQNCLHGGLKGFDKVVWQAKATETANSAALELAYFSKAGEEEFPGNLSVKAIYTLTHGNELRLDFSATTDAPTVCNLTQHSYYNLAGKGDVLNHELQLHASRFTPADSNLIPTGEIKSVEGTPFDFRKPKKIGAQIRDASLKSTDGYDHNLVLDKSPDKLELAATVHEPTSGRVMELFSTQPGVQFFTANFFDGSIIGKNNQAYPKHGGFCLEPQHFPDSPNKPQFPSTELQPGQTYRQTIAVRFSTK
ncbi:MAG TPA: aldose epimerase family protein [Verrucomicrobiae bacterium]|nr:aldose epimerase family protein [Verrucomicrobiae bacterium]